MEHEKVCYCLAYWENDNLRSFASDRILGIGVKCSVDGFVIYMSMHEAVRSLHYVVTSCQRNTLHPFIVEGILVPNFSPYVVTYGSFIPQKILGGFNTFSAEKKSVSSEQISPKGKETMNEGENYLILYKDNDGRTDVCSRNREGLLNFLNFLDKDAEVLDHIPKESFNVWDRNPLLVLGDQGVVNLRRTAQVVVRWELPYNPCIKEGDQ